MPSTAPPPYRSAQGIARIPPLAMRPHTLFYPPLPAQPSAVAEPEPSAPLETPPAPAESWPRRLAAAPLAEPAAPLAEPAGEPSAKISKPGWQSLGLWTKTPVPLYRSDAATPQAHGSPAPVATVSDVTLLTGATGLVGSAVARALLARGHTLRLLVRPGADRRNIAGLDAEIVEGDLTNAASLTAAIAGCRFLLHVAADYRLWVPNPDAMRAANVTGTTDLLRAAHAAGVERMVYCSSVAALGLPGDGTPGTEDTPVDPDGIVGVYKQSKYAAEQAVRALAAEGVPVVIVNPSAPVGPRDIRPTPTGKMILDAAAGRMPAYVETGLNVVHVDDVAHGMVLALERGQPGEAYILGGEDLGMAHLLALIDDVMGRFGVQRRRLSTGMLQPVALGSEWRARLFGTEPRVTREMLAMADKQMFYSSAKAAASLGYTHRPARQAVADAVAWFRETGMLRL